MGQGRIGQRVGAVVERVERRMLMSAGALDPTFGTVGVLDQQVLAVDAKGRLLVAGTRVESGPESTGVHPETTAPFAAPTLTRLNPDGSVDKTFGTGGTAVVGSAGPLQIDVGQVIVEPTGKLLVNTGPGSEQGGGELVQLTAAGQTDPTFGSNGFAPAGDRVALGPDGRITFVDSDDQTLGRLTAAGRPDAAFGAPSVAAAVPATDTLNQVPLGLAVDAAGRAVVQAEVYRPATSDTTLDVIRFTTAGKLDATFAAAGVAASPGLNLSGQPAEPAVAPDGTIYAGDTDLVAEGTQGQPVLFAFANNGKTVSGGAVTTAAGGAYLNDVVVDAAGRPIVALTSTAAADAGSSTLARLDPIAPGGVPNYDPTFAASGSIDLPVANVARGAVFLDPAGRVVVNGTEPGTQAADTARVLTAGESSVGTFQDSNRVIGSAGSYSNRGNTIANVFDNCLTTFYDAYHYGGDWAGNDFQQPTTLVQIQYAPRPGYEKRMVGGQFQVSSTADFSADVHTVYTVTAAPPAGVLTTVALGNVGAYQYARYIGPARGECNVAAVKFFIGGEFQLNGTILASTGSYKNQGNTAAHVFDGNLNTFYDAAHASGDAVGEDFGTPQLVYQVQFAARPGYASRMVGGVIEAADQADFSDGISVDSIDQVPAEGTLTTLSLYVEVGAHRYWRYVGPNGSSCNLAELEFDSLI